MTNMGDQAEVAVRDWVKRLLVDDPRPDIRVKATQTWPPAGGGGRWKVEISVQLVFPEGTADEEVLRQGLSIEAGRERNQMLAGAVQVGPMRLTRDGVHATWDDEPVVELTTTCLIKG